MNWLRMLETIAPIALAFTPLGPIAPIIAKAIGDAEATAETGPEKLAQVVAVATDAAEATNVAAGHVVIDPAVVQQKAAETISGIVQAVNAVHAVVGSATPRAW